MPKSNHPKPWRRGSVFGPGRRRPLDREQRAVWKARVGFARRAGHLTALEAKVAEAMLRRLGQDGRLDPSQATIASDAGCGERTVRRALDALASCRLVQWTRRLVRAGRGAQQTSNAYELLTPATTAPLFSCDGQVGRQTIKQAFSTACRALKAPTSGTDEWAKWNAERQLAAIAAW